MDTIFSKSNEKVKYIKSLNEKKFRQKYEAFYLEGIKVVEEVLRINKAINIMFIAYSEDILIHLNGGIEVLEKIKNISDSNIEIINIQKEIFEYMTDTVTPQGILAVLKIPEFNIDDVLNESLNQKNNLIILDEIKDSGNIGTIIRTAEAFGINTIFCIEGTADVYSPKVTRSTMGSILRQKIIYISKEKLKNSFEKIKKFNFEIIGTSLDTNTYINEIDFSKKYAFVLGNESNGISDEIIKNCNSLVKIPMTNDAESLNVGIAAGVILYEQFKNKK